MKTMLFLAGLFAFSAAFAQENTGSFAIKLNNKTVVKKQAIPGGEGIALKLKATQLKTAKLQLDIADADNYPGWKRKLVLNDAQENEVASLEKNYVTGKYDWNIPNLVTLLQKYKTLKLFTFCTPIDESQAAMIRVRRFHLCTLTLN